MGPIYMRENLMYARQVIDVCLNCKRPRCIDNCPEFADAYAAAAKVLEGRPRHYGPPKVYEAYGERHTIQEWADICGMPRSTLDDRLHRGETMEQALMPRKRKPQRRIKLYRAFGERKTLDEWAAAYGIKRSTLDARRTRMSLEEALTMPRQRPGSKKGVKRQPYKRRVLYDAFGERRTLDEWCRLYGMSRETLNKRRCAGMTLEEALAKPLGPGGRKRKEATDGQDR